MAYEQCRFRPLSLASIRKAFKLTSNETYYEIEKRHWFDLGLQLLPEELGDGILSEIGKDEKHHKSFLIRTLEAWMEHSQDEDVTWNTLLCAIECLSLETVHSEELAEEIRKWLPSDSVEEG